MDKSKTFKEDIKKIIIEKYIVEENQRKEIMKEYKISNWMFSKVFNEIKETIPNSDSEIKNIILKEYVENNMSKQRIMETYKIGRSIFDRNFKELEIKSNGNQQKRTYTHDYRYFELIDSEEKAYWLGYLFGDGWIYERDNGVGICSKDFEQIEKFKNSINATNPIRSAIKDGKEYYSLLLSKRETINDVKNLGMHQYKGLTIEFPYKHLKKELYKPFIRGLFDSDGSIFKGSDNIWKIAYGKTKELCDSVQNIIFGKIEYKLQTKNENINYWQFQVVKKDNVDKFLQYIYEDANIFLDRKYNLYKQCLVERSSNTAC